MEVFVRQSLFWALLALSAWLIYYFVTFFLPESNKHKGSAQLPIVGRLPRLAPRFLHNLEFAKNAGNLLEAGYQKVACSTSRRFIRW